MSITKQFISFFNLITTRIGFFTYLLLVQWTDYPQPFANNKRADGYGHRGLHIILTLHL